MVVAVHNAIPASLATIFTNLLLFGIHAAPWKTDKCILIPKQGKKEKDDVKSYHTISLLSCLGQAQEKVMSRRTALYGVKIGAIEETQTSSLVNLRVEDAVLRLLIPARTWLADSKTKYRMKGEKQLPTHPTLLTNDIDSAFNAVRNNWLTEVMTRMGFTSSVVSWTNDFSTYRPVSISIQGEQEIPRSFASALPRCSPLSTVPFSNYSAPIIPKSVNPTDINSIYVDNDTMLHGADSQPDATLAPRHQADDRMIRSILVGLQYPVGKSELIPSRQATSH